MSQRPRLNCHQWEGIYSLDFTLDGVRQHCRWLAETLLARKWSCLIAHDTRFMAAQFARYAYYSLETYGVQVSFCPTPAPQPAIELALDQKRADTALIISACNRPFWYNGLIALTPPIDRPVFAGEAQPPADAEPAISFPPPPLEDAPRTQIDVRTPYLETLRGAVDMEMIRRAPLTVFVDPMNGTTSGYIPAALGEGGQTKAIEINRETDPLFGRQPPQPTEASLNRLRKLVKESDSHLGVALSADGHAISVTDNTGEIVPTLDVALLLAQYLGRQGRQRGQVVAPQPANLADRAANLRAWEEASGLKLDLVANPEVRIAELLAQDRNSLLVGATSAGEITVGRYGSMPDAALAALLLIEITARFSSKIRTLIDEIKSKT